MDWLISWLGDEFEDEVLDPLGDFIKGIFEAILRFLFGWVTW
jgi:hypothetical protein